MSVNVGVEANFVDTQGLTLENVTDGLIYDQVLTLDAIDILHSVKFHQLTNDTVEKILSLSDSSVGVTMLVTQPELALLVNLSTQTAAQSPERNWNVNITDQSTNTTTLGGIAKISEFKIIDSGVGLATIKMTLDFITDTTSPAVLGVLSQ
jgi:hypothetical protein